MFKRVIKDLFAVFNLLMIVAMIVAFFFLVAGCASTQTQDPLGIFAMLDKELEKETVKIDKGWVVQDEDGWVWEYWAPQGKATIVLARCEYSFVRYQGIEHWTGTYYNQVTSFWGFGMLNRPQYQPDLEGLVGCVSWVENFMYGDYYI